MDKTPKYEVPCAVYSRIVGYYGRLKDWNVGKRQEYVERKVYSADRAVSDAKGFVDKAFDVSEDIDPVVDDV